MTAGFQTAASPSLPQACGFSPNEQPSNSLLLRPSQTQAGLSKQRDSVPNGLDLSMARERPSCWHHACAYGDGQLSSQPQSRQLPPAIPPGLCHLLCMGLSTHTQVPLPSSPSRLLSSAGLWDTVTEHGHWACIQFGVCVKANVSTHCVGWRSVLAER